MMNTVRGTASPWLRVALAMASAAMLAAVAAGCSTGGTADLTAGGELWDGKSLSGWRSLSGSWSVDEGALLGVGPRSRLLRAARCPASYRLRFEVAPHNSPEVDWAVALPVGDECILHKGVLLFAGGPREWGEAWQAVEVEVGSDRVAVNFPGLTERRQGRGRRGAAFADTARARALWELGFRFCERGDGLVVLAPPSEVWRRDGQDLCRALELGRRCVGESSPGIALVVPCTVAGDKELPASAGARFRTLVVEPLQ